MSRAEGATQKAGQGMSNAMKYGGAAAGAALGGLSTMVITTGVEFDEMHDSIVTATGASGEALKGLESDAKAVFGAIPVDMDQAAMAIGTLNTLTGATGDTLQDMSKKGLNAARMLGEDAGPMIDSAGKAMNVFELEGDAASLMLDQMFVASQDTGIGMNALAGQLQTFGPIMKNAGISTETSIALFGQLNKAGVDVTRVMPAINKTMRELAAEGCEDLEGALFDQFDAIKNASTETEALNIASEAFGAEGAQRLMMAIRNEGLELDALVGKLGDSEGAIEDNAAATDSMTEKFKVLTNKAKLMLEPLKGIGPALGPLGGMMRSMGPMTHGLGMAFGGLAGPKGIGAVRRVVPKAIMSMRALSMSMLTPPMGIVIAIGAVVVAIILVIKYWDEIQAFLKKYVLPILKKVGAVFQEIGKVIKEFATKVLGFLKDHWKDIVGIIMGPLGIILTDSFGIRTKLIELFTGMVSSVLGVFGTLKDGLLGIWQNKILPFFTTTIPNFLKDNWTTILVGIFTGLPGILFMVFRDRLKSAFFEPMKSFFIDTIGGFFTNTFVPLLKDIFIGIPQTIFGAFLSAAQGAWSGVLSFFTDTIPGFFTDNWQTILIGIFTGIPGVLIFHFRDAMWSALQGALDAFIGFGTSMKDWIMQGLDAVLGAVTGLGAKIPGLLWDGVVSAKNILLDGLGGLVGEILDKLNPMNWFGSPGLVTRGEQIPQLIWDGVMNAKGWLLDKIGGFASTIPDLLGSGIEAGKGLVEGGVDTMMDGLSKADPRGWFSVGLFGYGQMVPQLFSGGMRNATPEIAESVDELRDITMRYFKHVVKDGDYLNDWLTHLPESMRPALRKYTEFVLKEGDVLNDYLTHMPKELRPLAMAGGLQVAKSIGEGLDSPQALKRIKTALRELGYTMTEDLSVVPLSFYDTGEESTVKFKDALQDNVGGIRNALDRLGYVVAEDMSVVPKSFYDSGAEAMPKFADALKDGESSVRRVLQSFGYGVAEDLSVVPVSFWETGVESATSLGKGFQETVIGTTQSCLEAFVEGMGGPEAIERLGTVGTYWQGAMQSWLGAVRNIAAKGGVDAAIDYTEKLIEMLGENAGPATDALREMLEELKLVRESEMAGEIDAEALADKLMDTIDQKTPEVETTGVSMMTGTGDVMKAEAFTKAPEVGDALMQTLGTTLAGYSDQCGDWGGAVIAYTASGAFSYAAGDGASMMRETGQRLIDGMIAGLEAGKGSLFSTIQSIIAQAIAAAEAEAGTESPSTKFAKIGGEMGEGLTGGWASSLDDFTKSMSALNPLTAGRPDWLGWLKGGGPAMQPTAGGGRVYNVTVNNPRPMAAEDSIRRRLVVLQHLGV